MSFIGLITGKILDFTQNFLLRWFLERTNFDFTPFVSQEPRYNGYYIASKFIANNTFVFTARISNKSRSPIVLYSYRIQVLDPENSEWKDLQNLESDVINLKYNERTNVSIRQSGVNHKIVPLYSIVDKPIDHVQSVVLCGLAPASLLHIPSNCDEIKCKVILEEKNRTIKKEFNLRRINMTHDSTGTQFSYLN